MRSPSAIASGVKMASVGWDRFCGKGFGLSGSLPEPASSRSVMTDGDDVSLLDECGELGVFWDRLPT